VISCIEVGPFLELAPFLLMMGTSVGENWLILPEGTELVYLLWVSRTGGSSSLFIINDLLLIEG